MKMIKEENKKRFADELETVVGDIGFFIGAVIGSADIGSGCRVRDYFQRKIESFYQRHEIPYTPRPYLRKD